MRVIAGVARGQRLAAPSGRDVRPTADRVREALFSSLGPAVEGARLLDCYAGSGALGIEALSRGALAVTFVERDGRAARVIERNLESTGLSARAVVVRAPVERFCAQPRGGPFDIVLADPPYDVPLREVHERITELEGAGGLADAATVVVERSRRDTHLVDAPPGFLASAGARAYGDTVLLRYHKPDEQGSSRP